MRQRVLRILLEVAETLVLTVVLFVLVQSFVAEPYHIDQTSMENTLLPQQYVLVDKLSPHWDAYKRGDIVVFQPPASTGQTIPFIKRVIGLPGDVIDIRDGHVLVNGQEITEPYVFAGQPTDPETTQSHFVVQPNELFVLGDHRAVSEDSRVFGTVPVASVIGRAWLRYWPLGVFSVLQTPLYPDLRPMAEVVGR